MMRFLLLLTAFLVALPAAAQISDADRIALDQASARGRLIYAYDQAAWHGTDDMLAKLSDPKQVGGWIVRGSADAPELIFFDKAAAPRALYRARFQGARLAESHLVTTDTERNIDEDGVRMLAALNAAQKALPASGVGPCAEKPFNTVVLPPASPAAATLVYFLTPQTDSATAPLGGHYLFEVATDGSTAAPRRFSKACLPIALTAPGRGGKPTGIVVSHLLDPVPTEIHVFTALTTHQPVYVMTQANGRLWAVEGARIRLVEEKHAAAK